MDRKEIKKKRLSLLKNKKRLIKKGTEHNVNNVRFCSICGKQLTRMIINDKDRLYPYILSIYDHYAIKVGNINVYLCKNINSCIRELSKK